MNLPDIIVLLPLLYFIIRGFMKGFIITAAMLAGLVIGLWAAIHFSEYTAGLLVQRFHFEPRNIRLVAYILTFSAVIILVYLLGRLLTGMVKTAGLGIFNRLAGAIAGAAKGILLVSALILLINKIDPKSHLISSNQKDASLLYRPLEKVAPSVYPLLKAYYHKVEDALGTKQDEPENNPAGKTAIDTF